MLHALSAPMQQIADNCGIDGAVVVDEVSAEADQHRLQRQYRRVRRHVQGRHRRPDQGGPQRPENAASIAGLMLTTEAMITKIDKDDKNKHARRRQHPLSRVPAGRPPSPAGGLQPSCDQVVRELRNGPLRRAKWPVCARRKHGAVVRLPVGGLLP